MVLIGNHWSSFRPTEKAGKKKLGLDQHLMLTWTYCLVFTKSPFFVGLILFIIFFSDLLYTYNDFDYASYADDLPRWNPPWRGEGAYLPKRFSPSASTSRARQSDAATFDKDKQICFMLMPRTWFKVEEFRLE